MTEPLAQVGRVAFRREGEWWNAYYAMPNTMDGAIHLGSLKMTIAEGNPTAKRHFMQCMREAGADVIEAQTGVRPQWKTPVDAPEHERAGHS